MKQHVDAMERRILGAKRVSSLAGAFRAVLEPSPPRPGCTSPTREIEAPRSSHGVLEEEQGGAAQEGYAPSDSSDSNGVPRRSDTRKLRRRPLHPKRPAATASNRSRKPFTAEDKRIRDNDLV